MFLASFKENATNEATLVGKKFDEIIELLKLIYPNYEKNLTGLENAENLLQLSDEYCITSVKTLIEKSLVGKLTQTGSSKLLYGKDIELKIDQVKYMLNLADIYNLKKLRHECIECLSTSFTKTQLNGNLNFADLTESNRLKVYERKLDVLEDKLKQKEERLKKAHDECLKQKFEIKNLEMKIKS